MTGNENWAETWSTLCLEAEAAGLPRPIVRARALGTMVEIDGLCTRIRVSSTEAAKLVLAEVRKFVVEKPEYVKMHSVQGLVGQAKQLADGSVSNDHAGFASLKAAIHCLADAILVLQAGK